jgi:cell division protein FtsL
MICCGSKNSDDEQQRTKSQQIDQVIRQDRIQLSRKAKILLLGIIYQFFSLSTAFFFAFVLSAFFWDVSTIASY